MRLDSLIAHCHTCSMFGLSERQTEQQLATVVVGAGAFLFGNLAIPGL